MPVIELTTSAVHGDFFFESFLDPMYPNAVVLGLK
jgi:hypothetical protein